MKYWAEEQRDGEIRVFVGPEDRWKTQLAAGSCVQFYASYSGLKRWCVEHYPEADVWYTERNGDGIGMLVPRGTEACVLPTVALNYAALEWIDPDKEFGTGVHVQPLLSAVDRPRPRLPDSAAEIDPLLTCSKLAPDRKPCARAWRSTEEQEMDFMTITKPQLLAAMLRWEQDARSGKCLTHDEADAMPAAERAAAGTDCLWEDLAAVAAAEPPQGLDS